MNKYILAAAAAFDHISLGAIGDRNRPGRLGTRGVRLNA